MVSNSLPTKSATTARLITVSVLTSMLVGVVGLALILWGIESREAVVESFTTASGIGMFSAVYLFSVLPGSVPAACLGGWIAAAKLKNERGLSRLAWLWLGIRWGTALGALGCAAYVGVWPTPVFNPGRWMAVTLFATCGAVSGCAVGMMVAAYCACCEAPRLARQSPSSVHHAMLSSND